ncbi:MAG: alpha-galactosidase [Abditibacteriota bacterium]|nr:alpha-galactosidase [Abditibacteriota bacterium]
MKKFLLVPPILVVLVVLLIAPNCRGQQADFSFNYNGQPSSKILKTWKKTVSTQKLDATRTRETIRYEDPETKLAVAVITTTYSDFPAKHTVLYFRNAGTEDTGIISEILPLDRTYTFSQGGFKLSYAEGSHERLTDFRPKEQPLSDSVFTIKPDNGRPSDEVMPYFNVRNGTGAGMAFAIGWSGQWKADFAANGNSFGVKGGMEKTHFLLHPGERVRTPAVIALKLPAGDEDSGYNYMRSFLLKYFSPRAKDGSLVKGPITSSSAMRFEDQTAEHHIRNIALINEHKLESEYYFIDTGWGVSPTGDWVHSVGNFDFNERYPEGVAPISKAAKATGRGFVMWFEPERVMKDTYLYNEHPNWLITPPNNMEERMMYMYNDNFCLFDMANDEARAWLTDKVDSMIKEGGVTVYRQDFNMFPLPYWLKDERENRQGIHEIKYVTGLYDYIDTLLKRNPGLIFDNCASGGRRLDIELVSRSFALIRSDFLWDPTAQQCHTYGLNRWIPLTGIGAATTDMYNSRSGYGYNFGLALIWSNLNDNQWEIAARSYKEEQSIQDFFAGDFHPLTPYSTENTVWMAWQFHRKDMNSGIIQVFRRDEAPGESQTYRPVGLKADGKYDVEFADDPDRDQIMTGAEIMKNGIEFALPKRGSTYVTYTFIK